EGKRAAPVEERAHVARHLARDEEADDGLWVDLDVAGEDEAGTALLHADRFAREDGLRAALRDADAVAGDEAGAAHGDGHLLGANQRHDTLDERDIVRLDGAGSALNHVDLSPANLAHDALVDGSAVGLGRIL